MLCTSAHTLFYYTIFSSFASALVIVWLQNNTGQFTNPRKIALFIVLI